MRLVSGAIRTFLAVFPRVSIGLSTWKPYWIPLCLRSGFHNLVNVVCLVRGMPAARGRVGRYFGMFWSFCTFLTSPRGCCLLQTRSHCADPKQISWHEFVTGEFPLRDLSLQEHDLWDAFAKQLRKVTSQPGRKCPPVCVSDYKKQSDSHGTTIFDVWLKSDKNKRIYWTISGE